MDNYFKEIASLLADEELLTRVYQFNEWDPEMLQAIEAELSFRNLLPLDIYSIKQILIKEEHEILSEGKEATFPQQFLGWLGVLGVLGLIIGYNLAFAKTISKYTQKEYYKYDDPSRESGKYMFYISLTIIIVFCLYKFMNFMEAII